MAGSGIAKIVMNDRKATPASLQGDYNKRAGAVASAAVHNQPGSHAGSKK